MDICRHCGKTVRVDSSLGRGVDADPQMTAARTIWVDEALLRLCNAALEHATRAGTAEVEVSHLLLAALEARDHRLAIEAAGIDMEVLARTARRQVILADRRLGEASPRTSDMLRTILCRTTEAARAEGRECATFEHLVETLVLSCDDIGPIAELVSEAARQPSRPTGEARATELASWRDHADRSFVVDRTVPITADRSESGRSSASERDQWAETAEDTLGYVDARQFSSASVARFASEGDRPRRFDDLTAADPGRERNSSGDTRRTEHDAYRRRETAAEGHRVDALGTERYQHQCDRTASQPETAGLFDRDGLARLEARLHDVERMLELLLARVPDAVDALAARRGSSRGRGPYQNRSLRRQWRLRRIGPFGPIELVAPEQAPAARPAGMTERDRPAAQTELRIVPAAPAGPRPRPEPERDEDQGREFEAPDGEKVFYLDIDDPIVRAPSIGPKTAARLAPVGIHRVSQLLGADPQRLAGRLGLQHITARRVAEWQAQARLVCTVPWLRGTHAQLLVGAGYDTLPKLRGADPAAVCAAVLRFAQTRDGQSILRSGPPPDMERIGRWIDNARYAEPQRAA